MDRHRLAIVLSAVWATFQVYWLRTDRLIRDGDEEGHIGAAELFRDILREQGILEWLFQAWQGNFGEYPPLFAALLGGWWSLFPVTPEHPIIESFGSVWVLITAVCIARIVWREKGNWLIAFTATLLLPLINGLSRHFMPEILLTALVALFAMTLEEEAYRPSLPSKLGIGISAGLGLLSKQSFLLIGPCILLGFLVAKRISFRALFPSLLILLPIATPWYAQQLIAQSSYLQQAVQPKTSIDWLAHIAFYPSAIALIGWGVVGTAILVGLRYRYTSTKLPLWTLFWGIGALLVLVVIPKKYPRLLLPWLPILGIWMGLLSTAISRKYERVIFVFLFAQLIVLSLYPKAITIPFQSQLDDGCPQRWLRAPVPFTVQLDRVRDIIEKYPSHSVAIFGDVPIDCTLQSTHNWNYHVEPYLRRSGLHPTIDFVTEKNSIWKEAGIQIQWKSREATHHIDDLQIVIRN